MKKIILLLAVTGLFLTGCNSGAVATPTKTTQSEKAAEAAESINFSANAEIDNIKNRLELTSDPALTGFVLLMNEAGQPIMYTGVTGKITSGGKRLTKPFQLTRGDRGESYGDFVTDAPSDEGTWGSSSPYIYFWTPTGQYIQWNGKYLYSDQPFRTTVEPLVISVQ